MILNFKEIPEAHKTGGLQDTWELFSREFFTSQNYEIIDEPARGPDGGIDIKIRAVDEKITWLVSCKHKAHSGSSVLSIDEINIRDRVESNKCDGFIGFYSTIVSSGLKETLIGLSHKLPFHIYDREKIERAIVGFHSQERLFLRFFPESYKKFKETFYFNEPAKLFASYFRTEYSDFIDLYELLFDKIENILPYLRQRVSFEEMVKGQHIALLPIDGIEDTHSWNYQFKHANIKEGYSIKHLGDTLIPKEAEYIHGIKISGKIVIHGWSRYLGLYILYPNFIICSPQFIRINNMVFESLVNIIN